MPDVPDELLRQLVDLIDRLREEAAGFLDQPGDQQAWYNRGYANGVLLALHQLVPAGRLDKRMPDDPAVLAGHLALPWGRAYRHGETIGQRETHEITGTRKL